MELTAASSQASKSLHRQSYEMLDHTVYHYHPSLEQVRAWLAQAGVEIEEEGKYKYSL